MPLVKGRSSRCSKEEAVSCSGGGDKKKASQKKKRQLPRKCAVISRSLTKEGVEKTEFRFVTYRRTDGPPETGATQRSIFDDVGQFLQEQLQKKKRAGDTTAFSGIRTKEKNSTSTPGFTSESALSSTHHEASCMKSDYLRKALPTLERLCRYWEKKAKQSGDQEDKRMKTVADEALADVRKALTNGSMPIGPIQEKIRDLARECNDKKK